MMAAEKTVFTLGSHRCVAPEATWERLVPLMSTVGVSRMANVTGLDDVGLPVWQAIRPTSRSLSVSQGKGWSDLLAKISALMEAIEYWSAEQICRADLTARVSDIDLCYSIGQGERPPLRFSQQGRAGQT
jgi:ribosomal protein S12 methylthiotransferase accessory factor